MLYCAFVLPSFLLADLRVVINPCGVHMQTFALADVVLAAHRGDAEALSAVLARLRKRRRDLSSSPDSVRVLASSMHVRP